MSGLGRYIADGFGRQDYPRLYAGAILVALVAISSEAGFALLARYVSPGEFDSLAERARTLGFAKVVAGPFVRSSYHADEMVSP